MGLGLSALIGVPAGLLIGSSLRATQSTRWIVDFFRSIPTIALLPLVLLLFGATSRMEITMIALSAVWPLLIQSVYAAKQVEPLHKWVFRVFRISTVWVPSVALVVFTGLRLAATMALLMTISAEYLGGAPGARLGTVQYGAGVQATRSLRLRDHGGRPRTSRQHPGRVSAQRRLLWSHPVIRREHSA